jgi:hypothetical protein
MSFLGVYGLRASLPEKHGAPEWLFFLAILALILSNICCPEWSGSVGVTLGFFCGNAIIFSPLAIVYFYIYWA